MLLARRAVQARRHNSLAAYDDGVLDQDHHVSKTRHLEKFRGKSAKSFTRGIVSSLILTDDYVDL